MVQTQVEFKEDVETKDELGEDELREALVSLGAPRYGIESVIRDGTADTVESALEVLARQGWTQTHKYEAHTAKILDYWCRRVLQPLIIPSEVVGIIASFLPYDFVRVNKRQTLRSLPLYNDTAVLIERKKVSVSNSNGNLVTLSRVGGHGPDEELFYCGLNVGRDGYHQGSSNGGWHCCDGRCGPTNDCQCPSCFELDHPDGTHRLRGSWPEGTVMRSEFAETIERTRNWRDFRIGGMLDVKDKLGTRWYLAHVVKINTVQQLPEDSIVHEIFVHFKGFSTKWDAWFKTDEENICTCSPYQDDDNAHHLAPPETQSRSRRWQRPW